MNEKGNTNNCFSQSESSIGGGSKSSTDINHLQENLQKCLFEKQKLSEKLLEKDNEIMALKCVVRKASNSWLHRKSQLSESESDDGSGTSSLSKDSPLTDAKFSSNKEDSFKISFELKFKTEQLELSERQCEDLKKRIRDYEKVIDDQENIVHGLKEQLDTYFSDNKHMSKQLAILFNLFQELETANSQEVIEKQSSELVEEEFNNLPSQEEFTEISKSVSKTYMKLKELIYEKKSLVTEIERLKTLNVELQARVTQQESRLVNVSDALQTTWLIVSNLKEDHSRIHTATSILRYELKEKREILTKLRNELEWAREQWHAIRKINSRSEVQWKSLRSELDERKVRSRNISESSAFTDSSEIAGCSGMNMETNFEPPVDLLLDMGIEHGIVDPDDDGPATGIALVDGENVEEDRLQELEEQCSHLYQKLMSSTSRALALASRLTSLHEHYAESDVAEESHDEEYEYVDIDEDNLFEHDFESDESGAYDTAYVSENDGRDSASEVATTPSVEINNIVVNCLEGELEEDHPDSQNYVEDSCDVLSRRLITFLPKKIEMLKIENKKLEERLAVIQDEKMKTESSMKASIDHEVRLRKILEEQLKHLGKCVDELKLERNGKIAVYEEELQKRIHEVRKEQQEHQKVIKDLKELEQKYEANNILLEAALCHNREVELRAVTAEEALAYFKGELDTLRIELLELKNMNSQKRHEEVKYPFPDTTRDD